MAVWISSECVSATSDGSTGPTSKATMRAIWATEQLPSLRFIISAKRSMNRGRSSERLIRAGREAGDARSDVQSVTPLWLSASEWS